MRGKKARAIRRLTKFNVSESRKMRRLVPFDTQVPGYLKPIKGENGEDRVEVMNRVVLMHNDAARAVYRETKRKSRRNQL